MNDQSSRSHSLLLLNVQQRMSNGSIKSSRLNLVDRAGSERIEKTGAAGDTLEEAKKINLSLTSLCQCINALTEKSRDHIPYRNSKLTFMLKESLGGNTKTTLLVACSQHASNYDETLGTAVCPQLIFALNCLYALNYCLPSTTVCPLLLSALDYCLPSTNPPPSPEL
jgi:kinesin family protein 5